MKRDLPALAAIALVLFATLAGARDLWNPNEPIYGQAVVEMTAADEWLVPSVNGETFGEKPILYFWLARIAVAVLGAGETALRVPSALAGVLGVMLVYLLALPYGDRQRALFAAGVYGTTYIVFWSARTIQMDLLLTTCALGAVVAATRVIDHGLRAGPGWALAGAAAGLGFLAKGPVALVVSCAPIVGYALVTGRTRSLLRLQILAGIVACVVVAAPWYLMLWFTGEHEVLYEVLVRQNLERSVSPWDHDGPWWYYLREFWVDMAPWAFFVPLAVGGARRDENDRRLDTLGWVWVAVVIVFFSIPASKRSPYILPLAPAVALLVSGVLARFTNGELGRGKSRGVVGISIAFGALFVAAGTYGLTRALPEYPAVGDVGYFLAGFCIVAGAVLVVLHALPTLRRGGPRALIVTLAILFFVASSFVLPQVDAYKSARGFSEQVNDIVPADATLHAYRIWKWRSGYTYYTRRQIPRVDSSDELRRRWHSDAPFWVIVERGMLEEFRSVVGDDVAASLDASIGSNRALLFGNAGAVNPRRAEPQAASPEGPVR